MLSNALINLLQQLVVVVVEAGVFKDLLAVFGDLLQLFSAVAEILHEALILTVVDFEADLCVCQLTQLNDLFDDAQASILERDFAEPRVCYCASVIVISAHLCIQKLYVSIKIL